MKRNIRTGLFHGLKIALSGALAILVAYLFGLKSYISAGTVAILSVAYTKRETVTIVLNRLYAFIVALILVDICYSIFGYNIYAFFAFLMIFIPVCQLRKWNSAMSIDSVLISHFISAGVMNFDTILNEVALFVIGAGIALLANLFLVKDKNYMEKMKTETDELIKQALYRMSLRIMDSELQGYDGSCFLRLNAAVNEALEIAHQNYNNQITKEDTADIAYIRMREKQINVLEEIYSHLKNIRTVPLTAEILAEFFKRVSDEYSTDNTVEDLLDGYRALNEHMKQMPLPATREEFEDRAELYAVMNGIEDFLKLKREYVLIQKV